MTRANAIAAIEAVHGGPVWTSARWVNGAIEVRTGKPVCEHRFIARRDYLGRWVGVAYCQFCRKRTSWKTRTAP